MVNPQPLVALPYNDFTGAATTSLSMTDEDPAYPVGNLSWEDPAIVAKATTDTTVITITTPTAHAPVAIAIINSNAWSASLDALAIDMPEQEYGTGPRLNGWRELPGTSATSWALTLEANATPVWVGRVVLLDALYPFNLRYGLELGSKRPTRTVIVTRLGSKLIHDTGIRQRTARGIANLKEDEDRHRTLELAAAGQLHPFLFIPDENVNDAWWVRFQSDDWRWTYPDYDIAEFRFEFEELSPGPPLG